MLKLLYSGDKAKLGVGLTLARKANSSKPDRRSHEFETFQRDLRKVLTVSKKDLDAKVEVEKRARGNGNGASH